MRVMSIELRLDPTEKLSMGIILYRTMLRYTEDSNPTLDDIRTIYLHPMLYDEVVREDFIYIVDEVPYFLGTQVKCQRVGKLSVMLE